MPRDLVDELLHAQVKARLFGEFRAPTLGRLELVDRLGSGAMGTVFAAYDPRLERKVAVKVLREGASGVHGARVLREARALGKLAHPNVVAIHDADELDGAIYIVMELAPGVTLRAWMAATPARKWAATLEVVRQAGAGIAAAHRAGLVHRDIKPDNILVGDDRTRVVDFGLAGGGGGGGRGPAGDATHATVGTPAYMAPEVLDGAAASEASDQFAFAVTCFEAITGARPYAGATRAQLAAASATAAASVAAAPFEPAWLHAVIVRALAADPAKRFGSMVELLAAIDRGRTRARRRHRGYLVASALVFGGALGAIGYRARASTDPCDGAAERRATAWSPAIATRVHDATAPWGDRSVAALDAIGAQWEASYRTVCTATRVRGDQSDQLLELRMRCLDRTLDRIGALATVLGESAKPRAASAVSAIVELPSPVACEGIRDAGELALPTDPAARARVIAAEHELDRGWALFALARYADARAVVGAVERAGSAAPDSPDSPALQAATLALDSALDARIGAPAHARARLQAALQAAAAVDARELELEIWARLLRLELFANDDAHVVLDIAPFARVAAARAGRDGAELDGIVGDALRNANRLDEARTLLQHALASHDPLRADQRALIEMNLGSVELAAGDPVAAEAAFVHAEATAHALLGDGHPELALYADKLASAERARGKLHDALAHDDASVAVREHAFGADDRAVATSLFQRAETLLEAGQLTRATADLMRARAIRVKAWGDRSVRLGELDALAAEIATAGGHAADASTWLASAVALDPRVATTAIDRRVADWSIGGSLYDRWRATSAPGDRNDGLHAAGPVDAALSCAVAAALDAAGDHEHAQIAYTAALAALADEPSRTRLRALTGLHRDTTALRAAMPELQQ